MKKERKNGKIYCVSKSEKEWCMWKKRKGFFTITL